MTPNWFIPNRWALFFRSSTLDTGLEMPHWVGRSDFRFSRANSFLLLCSLWSMWDRIDLSITRNLSTLSPRHFVVRSTLTASLESSFCLHISLALSPAVIYTLRNTVSSRLLLPRTLGHRPLLPILLCASFFNELNLFSDHSLSLFPS